MPVWHETEKLKVLTSSSRRSRVQEYATRRQAMEALAEQAGTTGRDPRRQSDFRRHRLRRSVARELKAILRSGSTRLKQIWAERATGPEAPSC